MKVVEIEGPGDRKRRARVDGMQYQEQVSTVAAVVLDVLTCRSCGLKGLAGRSRSGGNGGEVISIDKVTLPVRKG